MKITKQPVALPVVQKVSAVRPGQLYRLSKQCGGSSIDESRVYVRNHKHMVSPQTGRTTNDRFSDYVRIDSSTCLTDGTLVIHRDGHGDCTAILLDGELIIKGELR